MRKWGAIFTILLILPVIAQGGGVLGSGGSSGGEGSTTTSSGGGGGGSKHLQMDTFIKDLEKWQKEKPDQFDYLKKLLYKEPFTTSEYVPPVVWVYYKGNETVTRSQNIKISADVINRNPIEIRRVVYLSLEMKEPGQEEFRQVNPAYQIIQTNEYSEDNSTLRTFPDITNFRDLKEVGPVKIRVSATDGAMKWSSSGMQKSQPPFYHELTLNVVNSPPEITNSTISGPSPARYNDPIEYLAEAVDPDGDLINITLHILDDQGKELRNESQQVQSGGVAEFKASQYGFFGAQDAGKNFTYYYTYGDGIDTNRTETFDGPHIKPSPKLWVDSLQVVPEDENYYWWQKYNFSLNVRSQDNNSFPLTVSLYTDTPAHPGKLCGTKTVTVTTEPQTVFFNEQPFDVADASQNFKYWFKYSEYDQYSKEDMGGNGRDSLNSKIIPYRIHSPEMLLNLLMLLVLALVGGVLMERQFNGGGK